jgi:uncharacterized protein (DUF608 family)
LKPAPFRYTGRRLLQIAMPMGGIGAGSICLNGQGGLQDFSLRHRPEFTAVPDSWTATDCAFALLHLPESGVTKLVEGPLPREKVYDQGLQAQGYRKAGYEGLPRFETAIVEAAYPFGHVHLTHPDVPLAVSLTGFSPFIPLDDKNSSIPCAILEYTLRNNSRRAVKYEFSFHLSHLAGGQVTGFTSEEKDRDTRSRNSTIPNRGVFFYNTEAPESENFATACLWALDGKPVIKGMWLRGPAWTYESISALWKEVSSGQFAPNAGSNDTDFEGRNGGSILFKGTLKPGQSVTHPILIAWHFPNSNLAEGIPAPQLEKLSKPYWHPYYAGVWKDARAVAHYVHKNYRSLRRRTLTFKDALFSSTVPREVIDAVSSNLAILKSPTLLRDQSGDIWGWEGCFTYKGSCHGSCTHVWNYAQALSHLFPQLERTLRRQELVYSMDENGHVTFRSALPVGHDPGHGFHAAADGQLGGILKLYRDWQISGDSAWLRTMYPLARRSLEYCIRTWDPDRLGALIEPHHNTYDIEFWGPDGMCSSIYLGALSAMSALAAALGEKEDVMTYGKLAERSARFLDCELFNGDYYQQKVQYRDLRDQSFMKKIEGVTAQSSEALRLLQREGPRYQYGSGCLSDGVIGAWMAALYGIETPMNRENIRKTLQAIYKNNFRRDLSSHANTQRPGYAMGHEAGLLLCSWPRGGKPTVPFIYSDEVWTGIEYQVASHLILEGFVREGLDIVKGARRRYDGHVRNPYNEYECGSYYARAMASYALLASLSGFRYSAVTKTLSFGPRLNARPFTCFFSTATAFGTVTLDKSHFTVSITEGKLDLKEIRLILSKRFAIIPTKAVARPGRPLRVKLPRF